MSGLRKTETLMTDYVAKDEKPVYIYITGDISGVSHVTARADNFYTIHENDTNTIQKNR